MESLVLPGRILRIHEGKLLLLAPAPTRSLSGSLERGLKSEKLGIVRRSRAIVGFTESVHGAFPLLRIEKYELQGSHASMYLPDNDKLGLGAGRWVSRSVNEILDCVVPEFWTAGPAKRSQVSNKL